MATPFAHVIPSLSSLSLVTDYSHAISPFCESFTNNLPLLNPASSNFSPSTFYHSTNPFFTAALASQAFGVFTFLLSSITGNYSQVDRIWSILPTVYIAHFTYFAHSLDLPTSRLDTLLTVAVIWSIRLTFNYWRKGGYQVGHEDYRWTYVRRMVPQPWAKVLFNMVFVSWFQNTLLFLIASPAYLFLLISALPASAVPESAGDINKFGTVDLIFSRAIGLALFAEFFADQQQWGFHKAKKAYEQSGKTVVPEGWEKADLDRGFCVVGLWSYSRHPNFVAEQAFWVMIYQWGCFVTDTVYNYTALGVFLYCMIFQGSTILTENISSGKYSEYKDYQRLVGRFLPKLSAFWDTSNSEEVERKRK